MSIKHVIVLDSEFVSARNGQQPFQIAMSSFLLKENKLINVSSFNVYIQLEKGVELNYYAKLITGISKKKLEELGIYPLEARDQILNFLLNFKFESTLIIGWDPINDYRMLELLFEGNDLGFKVSYFKWFDLALAYRDFYMPENKNTPSLKTAGEQMGFIDNEFHDADKDVKYTTFILEKLLKEHGSKKALNINKYLLKKKKYVKKRTYE